LFIYNSDDRVIILEGNYIIKEVINMTRQQILDRITKCEEYAYAYDWDYEPDDPNNLAEDYRQEAAQLRAMLESLNE
jgi:predicted GTPase